MYMKHDLNRRVDLQGRVMRINGWIRERDSNHLVCLYPLYHSNTQSDSQSNGFILNDFFTGAGISFENEALYANDVVKNCFYAYNPRTQRLILITHSVDDSCSPLSDDKLKYVLQPITVHLNTVFNSTPSIKDIIVFEPHFWRSPDSGLEISNVRVANFVENEEVKLKPGVDYYTEKCNMWLKLAKMLISAQYCYHSADSIPDFMQNLQLDRLTSLMKTTADLQQMVISLINVPEFKTPSHNAKITALRMSLYALKASYEKRSKEDNKYFGIFDRFFGGHSAADKLAAVTEYLEKGSTSRKAAMQGLLKDLIEACEANKTSEMQLMI